MKSFVTPCMYVFIDETGSVMSGPNESNLYICTAVIVPDYKINEVAMGLEQINQKHRNGAILKSKDVGKNHKLRIAILNDLIQLDFTFTFLITDKSKFNSNSPLEKYKKSRYKFLHDKLNKLIEKNNCNLKVILDKYGSEEFQEECLKYYGKHAMDLFSGEVEHSYADDKDQTILQIADFIGGTLLYCYDEKRKNDYSNRFRKIIMKKEVGYDFFPRGCFDTITPPIPNEKLEEELYHHLYNFSAHLLDEMGETTDEDEKMQFYVLSRLFFARCYEESENQWIFSDIMHKELVEQGYVLSKRAFTVNIIGGLRRKGIIISGSPSGYKLALTLSDINDYLLHDNNIIFPMLEKLKLAKDRVQMLIQYNILSGDYTRFDTILTALTDLQLHQYVDEPNIEKLRMLSDEGED